MSSRQRSIVKEGLRAGGEAAVVSGAPSTIIALATGRDPLEASLAAGSMVLPRERRRSRLLSAAVVVHLAISGFWGVVLAAVLPRRSPPVLSGAAAGLAIAVIDLSIVGRRFDRIRVLPRVPQLADHIAFGICVAVRLRRGRERPLGDWIPHRPTAARVTL